MLKQRGFIGLCWLCLLHTAIAQPDVYRQLRTGFKEQPPQARPKVYWWWLNDHADTTRLKEELQAMKKAGIPENTLSGQL